MFKVEVQGEKVVLVDMDGDEQFSMTTDEAEQLCKEISWAWRDAKAAEEERKVGEAIRDHSEIVYPQSKEDDGA
jgi:hypothetical protein